MTSDNPFSYGSASWTKLGKDSGFSNPLGETSWKMDTDWGSGSKDWSGGFGVDTEGKFGSGPAPFGSKSGGGFFNKLATMNSLFDKTRQTEKWQDYAQKKNSPFGGEWSKGGGGQVLENLGVVYPQQHSPMYLPGMPGEQGKGSAIGKAAGLGVGLLAAPFTGGASLAAIPFLSGAGGTVGGIFD